MPDLIPCRLSQVVFDENAEQQTIFVTEQDGKRRIPIAIGPMEAKAIDWAVKGQEFSRPLTHDLLAALLGAVGATLTAVRILDLRQGVFYAELAITAPDGRETTVDCRPSDAVALLVRQPGTPLLVAEHVLAEAGS